MNQYGGLNRQICLQHAKHSPAGLAFLASNGKWKPYPHCQALDQALIDVASYKTNRLMIFMPPQHGKSELAFRTFPAWHLMQNPGDKIVCASYGESLSKKAGFSNRELIREFGSLRGIRLPPEDQSVTDWRIDGHRGSLRSVGVGGGLTGNPADLIIIDDPFKDYEEALSPTMRQKVWDWYTTVALTRLSERGRIVLIQTRWHDDDLAGRLIKQMQDPEADQWQIISMPAINHEGQALCERLHSIKKLRRYKAALIY